MRFTIAAFKYLIFGKQKLFVARCFEKRIIFLNLDMYA